MASSPDPPTTSQDDADLIELEPVNDGQGWRCPLCGKVWDLQDAVRNRINARRHARRKHKAQTRQIKRGRPGVSREHKNAGARRRMRLRRHLQRAARDMPPAEVLGGEDGEAAGKLQELLTAVEVAGFRDEARRCLGLRRRTQGGKWEQCARVVGGGPRFCHNHQAQGAPAADSIPLEQALGEGVMGGGFLEVVAQSSGRCSLLAKRSFAAGDFLTQYEGPLPPQLLAGHGSSGAPALSGKPMPLPAIRRPHGGASLPKAMDSLGCFMAEQPGGRSNAAFETALHQGKLLVFARAMHSIAPGEQVAAARELRT